MILPKLRNEFSGAFYCLLSSPNLPQIWHVKSLKDFYKTTKNADADNQALFGPCAKVKGPELPAEGLFFPIRRTKSKKEINWKGFSDDSKSW